MAGMGSRSSLRLFVGVALSVMTGCLLTTSFDGIVGTKTSPSDASDASDVPTDAAKPDAKPDGDGSTESGPPTDAGGSFCSLQAHTFCADFDEGSALSGWTVVSNTGGGSVSLDTNHHVSAPAAAQVQAPAGCVTFDLASIGNAKVKKVHYAVDVQILASSPNYVTLASVWPSKLFEEFLIIAPDQTLLYSEDQVLPDGGTDFQSYASSKLPLLAFAHVTLDISLGPTSTVVVTINNTPVLSTSTKTIVCDQPIELQTGACTGGTNYGGTVVVDNVTLDLEY